MASHSCSQNMLEEKIYRDAKRANIIRLKAIQDQPTPIGTPIMNDNSRLTKFDF